jgi:hypothetical protein
MQMLDEIIRRVLQDAAKNHPFPPGRSIPIEALTKQKPEGKSTHE